MTKKSNLSQPTTPTLPSLGYTDKTTVKLDFDDASFKTVKYWATRALKWFRLGGFIILRSSKNHYHVLFDRSVCWSRNIHVVAWVWVQSKNVGLGKWLGMQCIKESSTLRVTKKKGKPSPRFVFRQGKQDQEISIFLRWRRIINKIDRIRNCEKS